jgi:hypothetical protein
VLEPFEVTDSADVTSVLLELSVQDRTDASSKDIG